MERVKDRSIEETYARFWSRVVPGYGGCLIWTGVTRKGYGRFKLRSRYYEAHRLAYEWRVGPIPEGLTLDHLCHTNDDTCVKKDDCLHRRCVNPAHLEPVTLVENLRRGRSPSARPDLYPVQSHCKNGHPLSGDNLYVRPSDGGRSCRTCRRAYQKSYKRLMAQKED